MIDGVTVPKPAIKCILEAKDSLEILKGKNGIGADISGSQHEAE